MHAGLLQDSSIHFAMKIMLLRFLFFLLCFLPQVVFAKPVLTPAEAPQRFFRALEAMDFAEAWASLTATSQSQFIEKLIAIEKDPKLTPSLVKQLFDNNDKSLQLGFWAALRHHIGVADWLKQKFELEKMVSETEVYIKALPARVTLIVYKEAGEWKFGFAETFLIPKPSPSPLNQ